MESYRTTSFCQRIGNRWLFVSELNSHVAGQHFIREKCGESPATVTSMWNQNWSVQLGLGEGDDWIVIGTQWKDWTSAAPQSIFLDKVVDISPAVERQWGLNRRIVSLIYSRQHWIVLSETIVSDDIKGQQLVKTSHWPGDEIQQLWAQGKRIQTIYGGPSDWTIIAETLTTSAPSQMVLAGSDPDAFNFQQHISAGYKLIGATFHPSSNIYSFLWELAPSDSPSDQQIYFKNEFPEGELKKLGHLIENR